MTEFWIFFWYKTRKAASMLLEPLAVTATIAFFEAILVGVPVGVALLASMVLGLPVWAGVMLGILTFMTILFLTWILVEWSDSETRDEWRKQRRSPPDLHPAGEDAAIED